MGLIQYKFEYLLPRKPEAHELSVVGRKKKAHSLRPAKTEVEVHQLASVFGSAADIRGKSSI